MKIAVLYGSLNCTEPPVLFLYAFQIQITAGSGSLRIFQNQRTCDFGHFKNLKESMGFMKEPVVLCLAH
jgi:hypothetical protein